MSEDIIKYADVEYDGEKYRAVAFNTELYKEFTDDDRLTNSRFCGYKSSETYYFKYEPMAERCDKIVIYSPNKEATTKIIEQINYVNNNNLIK